MRCNRSDQITAATITPRRWLRYPIDLPVRVAFHHGEEKVIVPGRAVELSRGGMALYAGLILEPGYQIEIEFLTPDHIRLISIIRNRIGYCFGLEFLAQLPS